MRFIMTLLKVHGHTGGEGKWVSVIHFCYEVCVWTALSLIVKCLSDNLLQYKLKRSKHIVNNEDRSS